MCLKGINLRGQKAKITRLLEILFSKEKLKNNQNICPILCLKIRNSLQNLKINVTFLSSLKFSYMIFLQENEYVSKCNLYDDKNPKAH